MRKGKGKGKGKGNGKPPQFTTQKVSEEHCSNRAALYLSVLTILLQLISGKVEACHGSYTSNIEKEGMVNILEESLRAADKKYKHSKNDNTPGNSAALDGYLNMTGYVHDQKREGLKHLIDLQRNIMKMMDGNKGANMSIFHLTETDVINLLLADERAGTVTHYRAIAKMIGMGNPEPMARVELWSFIPRDIHACTPADYLPTANYNWQYTRNMDVNTVNPFGFDRCTKMRLIRENANTAKPTHAKRAANLLVLIATLAHLGTAILNLLRNPPHPLIDHASNKLHRQQLIRLCQMKMFMAIIMTCPARASEVLDMSMDDFMEGVTGCHKDGFMLIIRALLDEDALPRGTVYFMRQWFTKQIKVLKEYQRDMLPEYASAISLPDIMINCMRVMLRCEPDMYLDPARNPHMHIFIGTGNGQAKAGPSTSIRNSNPMFGEGPLTTKAIDAQLKMAQALPHGANPLRWLTGYGCRVGAAVVCHRLGFLAENTVLCENIAEYFGHFEESEQASRYALSLERLMSCMCTGECACNVPATRARTPAQKRKKAAASAAAAPKKK